MSPAELVSLPDAAVRLRCTATNLRQRIRRGSIPGVRVADRWWLDQSTVDSLAAAAPQADQPEGQAVCGACGRRFERCATGRPPLYCSTVCRERARSERRRQARGDRGVGSTIDRLPHSTPRYPDAHARESPEKGDLPVTDPDRPGRARTSRTSP